jgi:hypothetical protein
MVFLRQIRVCVLGALLLSTFTSVAAERAEDAIVRECSRLQGADEIAKCLTAPRVWRTYGLANVRTGTDSTGKPVGRRILLAAVGPRPQTAGAAMIRARHEQVLTEIGNDLWRDMDRGVQSPDARMTQALKDPKADMRAEAAKVATAVNSDVQKMLHAATLRYTTAMSETFRAAKVKPEDFGLALFDTYCAEAMGCQLPAFVNTPANVSFQRYGKVVTWLRSNNFKSQDTALRLRLGTADAFAAVADPAVRAMAAVPWPKEPSAEQLLADFERLVKARRATAVRLNYAVVEALRLNPRSLLAIADIVDSPVYVGQILKDQGTQALKTVSDELARTRLLECVRLRGAANAAAAGECAGYKIDQAGLIACLNSEQCMPTTAQKATLDLLLISHPSKLKSLAVVNSFPRVTLGKNEAQFLASAKVCVEKGLSSAEAAQCVLQAQAGVKEKATIACIESMRSKGAIRPASLNPCIQEFSDKMPPEVANAVTCVTSRKDDARAMVLCGAGTQLPDSAKKVLACATEAGKTGSTDKEAVVSCLSGKNEQRALACVKESKDWQQGALCAAGDQLPKPVAEAMECVKSKSAAEAAVCVGGKSVPGDAGRLMRCAAESSFDTFGTALCMAGDGLTTDQRILLQCAMTSGGEPMSTATCTAGNLAMKEFNNCKGRNFGEAPCFGPNNDLLKLSKQLGVEIGPKSVVADIVNIQLRLLEVPMSVVGPAAAEAMKQASVHAAAVIDGHKAVLEAIAKGDLRGAVVETVKNECRRLSFGVIKC